MKISTHLNLAEVTRSDSAKRHGIDNTPTAEHLENFKLLAEKVFEPIRLHFKEPIFISSGYRSKALNDFIGGSASSQHCKGQAIDIDMDGSKGGVTNKMVFNFIKDRLDFDQLIAEFPENSNPAWVHVSYVKTGNRKQILVAKRISGATRYIPYKSDDDLK
jgi:zinc D-Ala-D-Ala carboxypeptidase